MSHTKMQAESENSMNVWLTHVSPPFLMPRLHSLFVAVLVNDVFVTKYGLARTFRVPAQTLRSLLSLYVPIYTSQVFSQGSMVTSQNEY